MKNQIVVITGSTRGLGYAIAETMLKQGATVVISGRSPEALRRAVKKLSPFGAVTGRRCDVRQERQVYAMARWVVAHHGGIDVWINNAGTSASAGRILDMPPHQALEMFMTNDMGTFYGARAALHFMLPRGHGTLVNVYGNGSFLRPATPTALYGASKAWMTSFSRSLAKEVNGSGVHIVGFSPGMLLTDMLTAPTVLGQAGRDMLKNYGFVLRLLSRPPEWAAEKLVSLLRTNRREFVEYRGFKPWTPLAALVRIGWENLTATGNRPKYKLKVLPPYRPKI
ncbi:MAG TPA: SDR family oxidoreductase [Anaerolineales bacterium]|nr:SDR family oxidoreductase [Anaerolineales bacterium]